MAELGNPLEEMLAQAFDAALKEKELTERCVAAQHDYYSSLYNIYRDYVDASTAFASMARSVQATNTVIPMVMAVYLELSPEDHEAVKQFIGGAKQ